LPKGEKKEKGIAQQWLYDDKRRLRSCREEMVRIFQHVRAAKFKKGTERKPLAKKTIQETRLKLPKGVSRPRKLKRRKETRRTSTGSRSNRKADQFSENNLPKSMIDVNPGEKDSLRGELPTGM